MFLKRFFVWNVKLGSWERNRFSMTDDGCLLIQVDDVCWEPFREEVEVYYSTGILAMQGKMITVGDYVLWGHVEQYSEVAPRVAEVVMSNNGEVVFKTFNLKRNHEFDMGCFAYANVMDKAVTVLGHKCELSKADALKSALKLVKPNEDR